MCQHCDNAPCETVCPVAATVHSDEGTNDMIYNRCVGTRYCANNCPYKVRRFNWFNNNGDMNGSIEHPLPLMKNPEVTLRSRGVMEKCTFCLHRTREGKMPACLEACPTGARVFGNILDPDSEIRWVVENKRTFVLKEELGTKPRFYYFFDE